MIMLDRLENIFDNKRQCDSGKFAYNKYTVPSPPLSGRQSIHSLLFQPLYNGHLFTMATFFYRQGGRCRQVQL